MALKQLLFVINDVRTAGDIEDCQTKITH